MRQEVAHGIHNLNTFIAALNTNVYVQTKNQVGAGHVAHLVDEPVIAFVGRDELTLPVGEGVRTSGCYQ